MCGTVHPSIVEKSGFGQSICVCVCMSVCAEMLVNGYLTNKMTALNGNFGVCCNLARREPPIARTVVPIFLKISGRG